MQHENGRDVHNIPNIKWNTKGKQKTGHNKLCCLFSVLFKKQSLSFTYSLPSVHFYAVYYYFQHDSQLPEAGLGIATEAFLLQNKLHEESALYYLHKHVLFLTHFAVLNLVDVRVFNTAHSSWRIVVPFAAVRLIVLRAINPKSSDAGHGPQPKDSFLCYKSRISVLSPSLKSGWLISFQFLYSCISSLAKHGHHSLPLFQQWLQTQYHFLQCYTIIVIVITIYLYYNSTHHVISAFQT